MAAIADFTETELWTLQSTLEERWGKDSEIDLKLAETDVRLSPSDRESTECPAVVWSHNDCNFIVIKSGLQSYRCQFFYRGYQQYGTGVPEYDDIGDCIISLLQVQADHSRESEMDSEGEPRLARGQEKPED
jgi:hypothetical protein